MSFKAKLGWVVALGCSMVSLPAGAQGVYKCGLRSYSQQPCSGRVIDTTEAPVPARSNTRTVDPRRSEQNRLLAQTLRRRPGEGAPEFATRRRRASLLVSDRDECARLDTRLPVEKARIHNPDPDQVQDAQDALAGGRKRYRELRC